MEIENKEKETEFDPVYFVRSPIFDRFMKVIACELYFCQPHDKEFQKENISMQDILDSFLETSFEEVIGGERILFRCPTDFQEFKPDLPPHQVGLGITSDLKEDYFKIVQQLSLDGYQTYLEDSEFNQNPHLQALISNADMVKVDIEQLSKQVLIEKLLALKKGSHAKVCACNINNHDEFLMCKELGFDYFQGNFLSKPWRQDLDSIPTNRIAVTELLCGLLDPEVTPDRIVELISHDPRLAYKLLSVINSAAFGFPRQIESLIEAVVMLGLNQLRCWASIIALSAIDDKPKELMVVAMVRAKMCEILADFLEQPNADSYFTVGLFSVLDALLDKPMEEVINFVPISQTVKKALIDHEGLPGLVLHNVIAYEQAIWQDIADDKLNVDDYREAYIRSLIWAKAVVDKIKT